MITRNGDGPEKVSLEQKFTDAGLSQHVTFHGWVSQQVVARHLATSDMLLLTSDFEGTPVAMMEALAAGCGMVGTRVSGIEDYENHPLAADCMGVYATGDIASAADRIVQVAAIQRPVRSRSARRLAETEFSMQVCMDRYYKAIDTIRGDYTPVGAVSLSLKELLYSKTISMVRYLKVKNVK